MGCHIYGRKQENRAADSWLLSFPNRMEKGKPDDGDFGARREVEWKPAGGLILLRCYPLFRFDSRRCVHVLQIQN